MFQYKSKQEIQQLEARKGGYFFLKIDASIVEKFPNKHKTRLICKIEEQLEFPCGLNHYGDGSFYVIISTKRMKQIQKEVFDEVDFTLTEHPNPLGVEIPEILIEFLIQDGDYKHIFDQITDGKKRSLIFTINRVKNMDLQIQKIVKFLDNENQKILQKKLDKKNQQ